jgi:hypothetical protein
MASDKKETKTGTAEKAKTETRTETKAPPKNETAAKTEVPAAKDAPKSAGSDTAAAKTETPASKDAPKSADSETAPPQPTTAAAKARSRSPPLTKKTGTRFSGRRKQRRKNDNSRGGKGGKQCVARIEHSSRHARAWRGHPRLDRGSHEDVDGRDKPGHDDRQNPVCPWQASLCHLMLARQRHALPPRPASLWDRSRPRVIGAGFLHIDSTNLGPR